MGSSIKLRFGYVDNSMKWNSGGFHVFNISACFHLIVGNNTFCQHIAFFLVGEVLFIVLSARFTFGYKRD